jgi:hypothetical protein
MPAVGVYAYMWIKFQSVNAIKIVVL